MADLVTKNNATSTLAAELDAVSTQLSINPADAGMFPAVSDGTWCPLTLVDANGNYEIVHASRRVGGIFTVARGQENTQARNFPVGTRVDLRLTSAAIYELGNNFIVDKRLPERLHPKNMTVPNNDANSIVENGVYDTGSWVKNCPSSDTGMLRQMGSSSSNTIQEWTSLNDGRQYVRMFFNGRWSEWSETTVQPDRFSPWAMKLIGEPFPLMDFINGAGQPPRDQWYKYIKLTANDGYNNGLLISETVTGSAPQISAWATIQCSGSPLNGQTIHLINTERLFLRAGNPGVFEDSQNRWHSHSGSTSEGGEHSHTYTRWVHRGEGPDGKNGWEWFAETTENTSISGRHSHSLNINGDGGSEARPRNMGVNYYMRIL